MNKDHTGLHAWQLAMELTEDVYRITRNYPTEELYGLTSQMRRSAMSIPSNIAEGHGRMSPGDFQRFLSIAHGSLRELETQLELSTRFGYVAGDSAQRLRHKMSELGRTINGLYRSLERRPRQSPGRS